ncbi:hypothetical protein BDY21DRAFT_364510 [Lineolata rhizophorae]|uniref:Uncharacterized protein n=1 Tax=Lineolata rhizophorae TaxID=578093 RepID=A0A6A6NZ06_9PEZI|nr:hypothetical protein BDY21DRAFT_364510 [Lineolata rhizophorae]
MCVAPISDNSSLRRPEQPTELQLSSFDAPRSLPSHGGMLVRRTSSVPAAYDGKSVYQSKWTVSRPTFKASGEGRRKNAHAATPGPRSNALDRPCDEATEEGTALLSINEESPQKCFLGTLVEALESRYVGVLWRKTLEGEFQSKIDVGYGGLERGRRDAGPECRPERQTLSQKASSHELIEVFSSAADEDNNSTCPPLDLPKPQTMRTAR